MKRFRIMGYVLFLALLLGLGWASSASATAGSAADPLISRSYLADTYYPEVRAALAETSREALGKIMAAEPESARRVLALFPGDSLNAGEGEEFTFLSGKAEMVIENGAVVIVSMGREASNGSVNLLSRHIVCEDSRVTIDIRSDSVAIVSKGVEAAEGSPFEDVKPENWFFADVLSATRRGLVDGVTPTSFEPGSTLTVAQCVKLAACMHQLWHEGDVTLKVAEEAPWYAGYVDYAIEQGILDGEPEDYDTAINREDFVGMFYRALPAAEYAVLNTVPEGSIPDIPEPAELDHGAEIYTFYRAGILMGYTETDSRAAYSFGPEDDISRAEVATIMNRMFDEEARVRFTMVTE